MNTLISLIEHTEDCDWHKDATKDCTCGTAEAHQEYRALIKDSLELSKLRRLCQSVLDCHKETNEHWPGDVEKTICYEVESTYWRDRMLKNLSKFMEKKE